MSRIDAHHHVWRLPAAPGDRRHDWLDEPALTPIRRDFGLADLAPLAAAAGVDATVLVQVLPDLDETRDFLALAADGPVVAAVVGWVDLTSPAVADDLAALRAGPGGDRLVGVRHLVQSEPDPTWLTRPDVARGLAAVGAAGLCYDLLTLAPQLPAATAAVRAHPDVTFVLDHLSKPPIAAGDAAARAAWAADLRRLAAAPNVAAKLSGLVTEALAPDAAGPWSVADLRPYADTALDAFGPRRLMFGSDWPVCLLAAGYAEVMAAAEELTAGLSPAERDEVFAGTARRVYGLRTRGSSTA